MNPYRDAFYQRQAEWHGYGGADDVRQAHENRSRYYAWHTRDWLPSDKQAEILDIGSGSGQFLYFLKKEGFERTEGIDLDEAQVRIGQSLGLNVRKASIHDVLAQSPEEKKYDLIAMLDIIEHFTREELFPLMELVASRLRPGGRLLLSVPNATSPNGLQCMYADITHEIAFTPTSLKEMLFCHGLRNVAFRDPWPAPLGWKRQAYRWLVQGCRFLESGRLRMLGIEPPAIWSNVMWAQAFKSESA